MVLKRIALVAFAVLLAQAPGVGAEEAAKSSADTTSARAAAPAPASAPAPVAKPAKKKSERPPILAEYSVDFRRYCAAPGTMIWNADHSSGFTESDPPRGPISDSPQFTYTTKGFFFELGPILHYTCSVSERPDEVATYFHGPERKGLFHFRKPGAKPRISRNAPEGQTFGVVYDRHVSRRRKRDNDLVALPANAPDGATETREETIGLSKQRRGYLRFGGHWYVTSLVITDDSRNYVEEVRYSDLVTIGDEVHAQTFSITRSTRGNKFSESTIRAIIRTPTAADIATYSTFTPPADAVVE